VAKSGVYSYQSPVKINGNGTVKARVKDGTHWSAMTEATFSFPDSTLLLTAGLETQEGNGNFPNPFQTKSQIWFNLPAESTVKISIFTTQGKLIETLFEGKLGRGTQYQTWTPKNVQQGIYIYQIQYEGKTVSGKMVYVK